MIDQVAFPAVAFSQYSNIHYFNNDEFFRNAWYGIVKAGIYTNMLLVDSNGESYTINQVRILDADHILWKILDYFVPRRVRVEIDVVHTGTMPKKELKYRIIKLSRIVCAGMDPSVRKDLYQQLKSAVTYADIIDVLKGWI